MTARRSRAIIRKYFLNIAHSSIILRLSPQTADMFLTALVPQPHRNTHRRYQPQGTPMIIGYAAGAYDLFHYLPRDSPQSKENCDYLIAGVVHDDVLEVTKRRPVIPIEERAAIVSHIDYVDEVHVETTPTSSKPGSRSPSTSSSRATTGRAPTRVTPWKHASQRLALKYTTSPTPSTPPAPSCARSLTCSKQSTTCA